ncbi:hypothetical protein EZV62_028124 [Acer yangbiense]|uniref:Gnk2-homologous domain-containing protein n=1 Tax=Acer yangbiense TaxID=1000413 RepID=A0A5C7GPD2_9ROSI|nr:hypothetical protein EZV62_028124 [Acer yangbiense]
MDIICALEIKGSAVLFNGGEKCYDTGNFTANSTYARNRDLILSSLASNVTEGFYKATIGQDSNEVYALALCSGDSSTEECSNCMEEPEGRNSLKRNGPHIEGLNITWGKKLAIPFYRLKSGKKDVDVNSPNSIPAMNFTNLLFFFLSYMLISIGLSTGQKCYDTGNFTTNSTYGRNRDLILLSLASNVTEGFYNATIGQDSDEVYALALCSGDSSAEECSNCVNLTSKEIMTKCPNQKEAFMWGWQLPGKAPCYVRYSNRSFFGVLEQFTPEVLYNTGDITSDLMTEFNQIWQKLMGGLVGKASITKLKFATEEANLTEFQTIYALMQCTPDLSQSNCSDCLRQYVAEYQKCCNGKQGGVVQGPNCISRWDLYPFYEITATPDAPPPSPLSPPTITTTNGMFTPSIALNYNGGGTNSRTIVIIVFSIILFFLLVSLAYVFLRKRKAKQDTQDIKSNQGRN